MSMNDKLYIVLYFYILCLLQNRVILFNQLYLLTKIADISNKSMGILIFSCF